MKYSIIIPAHDSQATLERCLRSILGSRFSEPYELIVVDDASRDDTPGIAARLGAKVLRSPSCRGPGFARNLGAKAAEGGVLVFIDSDVLLSEDTLQKIDDFFRVEKDFSVLSCNFDPACEMTDPISRYKHLYVGQCYSDQPKEVYWVFASTVAVKKDVFQSAGGFGEKTWVLEDELFGRKLSKKGYRLAFGEQIRVNHVRQYSFFEFLRGEIRRSRVFTVIKFADFFNGIKHSKDTVAPNIRYSLGLFPFLIVSGFLVQRNFLFTAALIVMFYAGNYNFLMICKKQFGIKFMLQATFLIPLDCLFCWSGIVVGSFDFLGGKKLELS